MLKRSQVLELVVGVNDEQLDAWAARGWVAPLQRSGEVLYREVDIARVRLIQHLQVDLAVDVETLPTLLSLMDQIYGLRHELRCLADAVQAQPEPVRTTIRDHVAKLRQSPADSDDGS